MECDNTHPEHGRCCGTGTNHEMCQYKVFEAGRFVGAVTVPNPNYVSTTKKTREQVDDVFTQARRGVNEKRKEEREMVKRARDDDPWTSKLAAERIEPKAGTRMAEVLDRLRAARGEWVNGTELATEECGGSEGLKRCRELRYERGYDIRREPNPESPTSWRYRLVEDAPVAAGGMKRDFG